LNFWQRNIASLTMSDFYIQKCRFCDTAITEPPSPCTDPLSQQSPARAMLKL
jgi:hypothetical protein